MSVSFTASDIGFETNQGTLDLSSRFVNIVITVETIELGGFSFPKELPQPVFLEDNIIQFTRYLVFMHRINFIVILSTTTTKMS